MSELLIVNHLEVQWFFCVLFSIIKNFLNQNLGFYSIVLNWMVEINFMEMDCQPAKTFSKRLYYTAKNVLKE